MMPESNAYRAVAALAILSCLAGCFGAAEAQAPPAPPAQAPADSGVSEVVRVDLVQVNVLVTDKKGQPVRDLTAQDITIVDNGVDQQVAFVERYSGTTVPAPTAGAAVPATSGPAATTPAAAPVQAGGSAPALAPEPRWLVLFFDNYLSSLRTRHVAVEAARKFVETRLLPTDRVAVVNMKDKPELVQAFTGDRDKLLAACSNVESNSEYSTEDRMGLLDDLVFAMQRCTKSDSPAMCASKYGEAWKNDNFRAVETYLTGLITVIRAIGSIPDVKIVVVFSDGIPRDVAFEVADAASIALGDREGGRLTGIDPSISQDRAWDRVAEAASQARVSIFPIAPGSVIGRFANVSARNGAIPDERNRSSQIDIYQRSDQNMQQGLVEMARRTGGQYQRTADPLIGLEKVLDLSAGLYTVGFYPRGVNTALSEHEVKVKAKRKGVNLTFAREVPRSTLRQPLTGELTAKVGQCENGRRRLETTLRLDRARLTFDRVKKSFAANFSLNTAVQETGAAQPAFSEFHFFNIENTPEQIGRGEATDPRIDQTWVVPCRALDLSMLVIDSSSGAHGSFSAHLEP